MWWKGWKAHVKDWKSFWHSFNWGMLLDDGSWIVFVMLHAAWCKTSIPQILIDFMLVERVVNICIFLKLFCWCHSGCRCEKKVLKTIKVLLRQLVYCIDVNLQKLKDVDSFVFWLLNVLRLLLAKDYCKIPRML